MRSTVQMSGSLVAPSIVFVAQTVQDFDAGDMGVEMEVMDEGATEP